jgi:hypothetical protein
MSLKKFMALFVLLLSLTTLAVAQRAIWIDYPTTNTSFEGYLNGTGRGQGEQSPFLYGVTIKWEPDVYTYCIGLGEDWSWTTLPNIYSYNTPGTKTIIAYLFQNCEVGREPPKQSVTATLYYEVLDTDGDGIPDHLDNCPYAYNPDQADSNSNGIGDACDDSIDPVDKSAPDVTITTPEEDEFYKGEIQISGTATDENNVNVSMVVAYSSEVVLVVNEDSENTYNSVWDSGDYCGPATVTMTASDEAGNVGSDSVTFNVDNAAPVTVLTLDGPNYDDFITTETEIILTAKDDFDICNGIGVKNIYYAVYKHEGEDYAFVENETINGNNASFFLTEEGIYKIVFSATDELDNVEDQKETFLTIDTTAPGLWLVVGEPKQDYIWCDECTGDFYATSETEITIYCEDTGVGDSKLLYKIDDEEEVESEGLNQTLFMVGEDGEYNLVYWCTDALGNAARDETIFYLDNTAPESWMTVDPHNYDEELGIFIITPDTVITLECNDLGVGMTTIYWHYATGDDLEEPFSEFTNETEYTEPISFNEVQYYKLLYWCVDGLGNTEEEEDKFVILYLPESEDPIDPDDPDKKTGGGGSPIRFYEEPFCIERWECSQWSACVNGVQTRTCEEVNNCGTTEYQQPLAQSCTFTTVIETQEEIVETPAPEPNEVPIETTPQNQGRGLGGITGNVIDNIRSNPMGAGFGLFVLAMLIGGYLYTRIKK